MSKRRFALLTGFTLIALAILIALGTWQVQRLHWKQGLISEIEAGLNAPPKPLGATPKQGDEFHRVILEGHFLHQAERHIYRGGPSGGAGYHIFTPFETLDGRIIFINRGWVPEALKDPQQRAEGQIDGLQTIQGVLRFRQTPPRWGSSYLGDAEKNIFYLFWPEELGQTLGLNVEPYYIAADDTENPGGWPKGGVTKVDLPNNHLQYALTWYGLGLTLIGVYLVMVYRRFKA
ncbi:MAG: SURF1 family protein [Sphingomonadales bacterium]